MARHPTLALVAVPGSQNVRAHLVAHHAHDGDEGIQGFAACKKARNQLANHLFFACDRLGIVAAFGLHELPVHVIEGLQQGIEMLKISFSARPSHARGDRALHPVAHTRHILEHLLVHATATEAIGDLLVAIDRDQDIVEPAQKIRGQIIDQRAIGLQLKPETRVAAHHVDHVIAVEHRLPAVESHIHLALADMRRNETIEHFGRIADMRLRIHHITHRL